MTQALFDYVVEETEAPVASISETSESTKASEQSEPVINKPETSEPLESIKPISEVVKTPSENIESSSKEVFFTFSNRTQQEEHLRKRAIKLDEDPNVFVIITEKDRLNSTTFQYRMEINAQICGYAKESEEDPKNI